jgi:hypothetical protein
MDTFGTVLIMLGIIVALAVGILITIGVIPLDRYIGGYQEKRAREARARERKLHGSPGESTGDPSASSEDTRPSS